MKPSMFQMYQQLSSAHVQVKNKLIHKLIFWSTSFPLHLWLLCTFRLFAKHFFKLLPIWYKAETKTLKKFCKFSGNPNTGQSYILSEKCYQYWRYKILKKYLRQISLLLTTTTGWSCMVLPLVLGLWLTASELNPEDLWKIHVTPEQPSAWGVSPTFNKVETPMHPSFYSNKIITFLLLKLHRIPLSTRQGAKTKTV